jgi:hypothetical protein
MHEIPSWLQRVATGRVVVAAVVAWLTYAVLLFRVGPYATLRHATGGPLLEETFGYDASQVQAHLGLLGEASRSSYHAFQLLDGLNALLMTIALTFALVFALSRLVSEESPLRLLSYLPVVAGVGELLENSLLLTALARFPTEAPMAGVLLGSVTSAKLVTGSAALLATVICFVALGIKAPRIDSNARQ